MARKRKAASAAFTIPELPPEETPAHIDGVVQSLARRDYGTPQLKRRLPLWAKWTPEGLRATYEEMTAREFDRAYRQMAISDADMLFKPAVIDTALDRRVSIVREIAGTPWAQFRRFGGCDLAYADAAAGKAYFAFATLAVDGRGHYYVLHLFRARGYTYGQQLTTVRDLHRDLQHELIAVESNAAQKYMVQGLGEVNVPVKGVYTGAAQKRDMEIGLPAMAGEFEQGKWHIPWHDAASREMMLPLVEELRSYPSEQVTSDCLMACFFARSVFKAIPTGVPSIIVLRVRG